MLSNIISINKKSFLALIIISILLFSVMSPVVFAVNEEHSYTEAEQKYEEQNKIVGEVIDFSDGKEVVKSTLNRETGIPGRYSLTKNGSDYTITLENVTAKKIILPSDVADGGDNAIIRDDKGNIKPRQTHITIILNGTNDITGYGLTGYYVKGITIKGGGSLNIKTHLEEKNGTYYVVPGIFVETDEIDDKEETKNTGLVLDNVRVNVTNPYYWGVICNGDIELKNGAKLNVNSYDGIKKRAEAGDISTDKLFVGEDCKVTAHGKVLIFKEAQQIEQEKAREKAKYKDDNQAPEISGKLADGTEIEEMKDNGTPYCEQPTITVKDNMKIAKIKVNEETITKFIEDEDNKKSFVVPGYLDCLKTVVATDMNDNETKFTFKSNSGHTILERVIDSKDATCTEEGYRVSKYICLICGEEIGTETKTIAALGHKYTERTYSTYKTKTCTRCGDTITIQLPKVETTPKQATVIEPKSGIITEPKAQQKKIEMKEEIVKVANSITASNKIASYSKKAQTIKIGAKQLGDAKLTYSSNNKSITVNASGVVTVKAGYVGKATITITANDTVKYKKATKTITVTINKVNNKITASNFTKKYSSKAQTFSIGAKQAGNAKLTYSSNNKSVKVNSSGKVTIAKGFIGKATITITANATSAYNKVTKKITITVNPPAVKISKLSNTSKKTMTVKWAKTTAVTGYQIQYSTDKNFKKGVKTVTVKKNSTTSSAIKNLTKNKKYYVRIRSYKTVSKVNYYSSWSSVKNITIKK